MRERGGEREAGGREGIRVDQERKKSKKYKEFRISLFLCSLELKLA